MPLYKFASNDVYINTIKTYPEVKLFVYNLTSSFNNTPNISGSFTGSIRMTTPGHISLFEMNIDRDVTKTGLITPFVIKDGTRIGFRTTTNANYASNYQVGDIISGSYPETSSITKEYYTATTPRYVTPALTASSVTYPEGVVSSGSVSHLHALKNTIDYYTYVSPYIAYSSSVLRRDLNDTATGLISVPSIFYGSQIKPGSVNLQYYWTGSLFARAQDTNRDGVLYDNYTGSPASGSAIGFVLYNEGFIVLTSSVALKSALFTDLYVTGGDRPRWRYFAQSIEGTVGASGSRAPNSAFLLHMSGTSKIQNMTLFATAPKGELNHSNNPSFVDAGSGSQFSLSPQGYVENPQRGIKNVVSSAYNDPTGSFEKTTYISKIGIYDKNQNLIAIAKPATPVKKTAQRDFTFKLKLDI
tara:strand:- start:2211 stop:3452 length:1242 start_codon:yes stop_codon:yes gene_type:complete